MKKMTIYPVINGDGLWVNATVEVFFEDDGTHTHMVITADKHNLNRATVLADCPVESISQVEG